MIRRLRPASSSASARPRHDQPNLDRAEAFRASMPVGYRKAFDVAESLEHSVIADHRAGAAAHVEAWRQLAGGGAIVCIIADDRPGLLSLITASLAAARMNVQSMRAYTRARPDAAVPNEAVDFVWLRREDDASLPVGGADVSRIAKSLTGLVTGDPEAESVFPPAYPGRAPSPDTTRVAFAAALDAGRAVLTVEASDRPGLLLAVTLALFRARVQIVASRADTDNGGAADRFTIAEFDGTHLSRQRRREVEAAVLAALDALGNRAP